MAITHGNRALSSVLAAASDGTVLLPNFQRGFVWSTESQAALSASILLGIPSGALLLIDGKKKDFSCREIGTRDAVTHTSDEKCEFLLDGQQRITSLRQVFQDPFSDDWEAKQRDLYRNLCLRWSLQVIPQHEEEDDPFGYRSLKFETLPTEPELIADKLNHHPIYLQKKDHDKWFHPGFKSDLKDAQRNLEIARLAGLAGAIPLWRTLEQDDKLVKQALARIATTRVDELRALLADGELPPELVNELGTEIEERGLSSEGGLEDAIRSRGSTWESQIQQLLFSIGDYTFPTISLQSTELDRAVVVFEAINRGGEPLRTFDLVSARYAQAGALQKPLAELIVERVGEFSKKVPKTLSPVGTWQAADGLMVKGSEPTGLFQNFFLQVLTARIALDSATEPVPILTVDELKKKKALALSSTEIVKGWEAAVDAVVEAWRFLQLRLGVPSESALRNKLLVLPIALVLSDPKIRKTAKLYDQLEYWYWASTLTDTYSARQNELCVEDTNTLLQWFRTGGRGDKPFSERAKRAMKDIQYSDKETLLGESEETVGTDVGLYLLQFVAARGGQDLLETSDQPLYVWEEDVQDHHLIPLGSMTTVGESSKKIRSGVHPHSRLLNSPLNRAYIKSTTNADISSMPIGQYMQSVTDAAVKSLYFTNSEEFSRHPDESEIDFARRVLSNRFDSLAMTVSNYLRELAH